MRKIVIEWPAIKCRITAELFTDRNLNLNDLLWRNLPYRTLQTHALVSGHHFYHLTPFFESVIEIPQYVVHDRRDCPDGTVFLSRLQHLGIKVGGISEYLPAAPIGQVIKEDLPALKRAGERMWEAVYRTKQVVVAHVMRDGEPVPAAFPLPNVPECDSEAVQELVAEIWGHWAKIWTDKPEELVKIHAGTTASGAGSWGQYFSTLVFVKGEQQPFGYNALGGLLRSCRNRNAPVEVLTSIASEFLKTPAEFLGYCGLDTQRKLIEKVLAVLPEVRTRLDFENLMGSMGNYANAVNAWTLHLFPWHHGEEYPIPQTAAGLTHEHDTESVELSGTVA